jgi:hypothetical protein
MSQHKNNPQQIAKAELHSKALQTNNPVLKQAMLNKAEQIGKTIIK